MLGVPAWEHAAGIMRIESCQARWLFDQQRMRFCRAPKGVELDIPPPDADWTPYVTLEVDAETGDFAVVLNGSRTRVLRSHVHDEQCTRCIEPTAAAAY